MSRESSTIRLATVADAAAIAEVQVASWHAAYRGLIPDERLDAFVFEVRHPRWQKILSEPSLARTTVLLRGGRVVAFASVGPSRDEPAAGEVWALYAHPGSWGSGAGREILAEGLDYLDARGLAPVMLWVLEGNERAIRFYQAAGFRLKGGRKVEHGLAHLGMRMSSPPDQ